MRDCFITFRSVTPAQKGEAVLRRRGFSCYMQRTPKLLQQQGCGYCITVSRKHLRAAIDLLREAGVAFQKVYLYRDKGFYEELQL